MEVTCFASYIMKTSQCEKIKNICFEEYIKEKWLSVGAFIIILKSTPYTSKCGGIYDQQLPVQAILTSVPLKYMKPF